MASFEFITDERFRNSLESDYAEMCKCMEADAHKAVHVLAGSLIEALLIDCLLASGYAGHTENELCRMDFAPLVTLCKSQSILTQKTEDLSSVVRTYRNLIHPGRLVRLDETVGKNGAVVAKTLVEIIVDEVAKRKRETYGYTAEQILTKVENDISSISIISHLLRDL